MKLSKQALTVNEQIELEHVSAVSERVEREIQHIYLVVTWSSRAADILIDCRCPTHVAPHAAVHSGLFACNFCFARRVSNPATRLPRQDLMH